MRTRASSYLYNRKCFPEARPLPKCPKSFAHLDNNRCNIEVLQMPATIPQLVDQELDELIRSAIMQKHLLRFSIKAKSELQNPTTTVSKTESSAYPVFK